jgi:hypothetical protein
MTCPEMVVAPDGSFTVGSPSDEPIRDAFLEGSENQISVTISKPIAVGRSDLANGATAR